MFDIVAGDGRVLLHQSFTFGRSIFNIEAESESYADDAEPFSRPEIAAFGLACLTYCEVPSAFVRHYCVDYWTAYFRIPLY